MTIRTKVRLLGLFTFMLYVGGGILGWWYWFGFSR